MKTGPFIPFVSSRPQAAPAAGAAANTAAPSAAGPGRNFQPLTLGAPAAPNAHAHGEPRVTLERDGDRVTHIKIECSCGQTIQLACDY